MERVRVQAMKSRELLRQFAKTALYYQKTKADEQSLFKTFSGMTDDE
jgi:hypothetical protein